MTRLSPQRRDSILVVDDDPVLLELAYSSLRPAGYIVELAKNGIEAVAKLDKRVFDLIVTDLGMPELDGFGLLETVRRRKTTRSLPVIVITQHDDFSSIERAYAFGATSFMVKPLNWTQFGHHVRYILRASRQEAEVREGKEAAEAASRMKSDLLRVVTHEFRTPLHQILGFSELLAKQEADGHAVPGRHDYSRHIREAAQGLDRMVSDMLIFSRLLSTNQDLNAQDIPVAHLMSLTVAADRARASERGIQIAECFSHDDGVDLICDRTVFERALSHLIDNAVKHSPEGGTVVVGCEVTPSGQLICFVKDRGVGLERARVEALLAPFSQGDMSSTRTAAGIGIGLSIARLAAEAHGGRLFLDTAPGAGTTAGLVFPRSRVKMAQLPAPEAVNQ